ncbi:MAG: ABC transporter substrate-binding protein, partial [Chloroflexota bacterium]
MKKIVFLLGLFLLVGISGVSAQTDSTFTCPKQGGTLITAIADNPVSLNGIYANDGVSGAVLSYLFNPLTLGGENWGTNITGDLAESWSVSDDGLTWTFNLHHGVKFSDGKELTAADVVYTFNTIETSAEDIAPFRPRFYQGDKAIKFEAKDDYTVIAHLTEPNASFFTDISVPIIPNKALDGQDLRTGEFNRKPVGTGPYKVTDWTTGESITLEANENYFKGRPCIDKIIFRIIPDLQAQVNALLTGELDFLLNVPGASVDQFKTNTDFTLDIAEYDSLFGVFFNNNRDQFKDKRVRQALMIAIDRKALVDTVRQGYGAVHNSHFDQAVPFYKDDKLGGYDYDPKRAGELLDAVGIKDTDGDGIRDLDN